MLEGSVATVLALSIQHAIVKVLAVGPLCLAKVVSHRIKTQEADEGIQLANTVLKWCSTEAPAMDTHK